MKRNLRYLVCGLPDSESELGEVLNQIGSSLNTVIDGLVNMRSHNHQISLFGSFLGRSLLELGCTAIIARIDPFRVLILREVQMQPSYQIGEQNKVSVQWQGDVLGQKVTDGLWTEKNVLKATRALLGDYYEHIYWKSALETLIDKVPDGRGGEWFVKIRNIGSEKFCSSIRGELRRLYSTLSKGIHHEFVIPTESVFDYETISNAIRDSLYIIASLGLALNSISHTPYKISLEKSINYYENLQKVGII